MPLQFCLHLLQFIRYISLFAKEPSSLLKTWNKAIKYQFPPLWGVLNIFPSDSKILAGDKQTLDSIRRLFIQQCRRSIHPLPHSEISRRLNHRFRLRYRRLSRRASPSSRHRNNSKRRRFSRTSSSSSSNNNNKVSSSCICSRTIKLRRVTAPNGVIFIPILRNFSLRLSIALLSTFSCSIAKILKNVVP